MGDDDHKDPDTGYKRPPSATRFKPGQSGNPSGRPRGRFREAPYEAVLGQMVILREDGASRRVTAAEAFLMQLAKRGLEGDAGAARLMTSALEEAKSLQGSNKLNDIDIVFAIVSPGSVNSAMEPLRMAKKLDPYRETARMAIEPWLVEAALARLGDRRLTREEQRTIVKATRTPKKVHWPDWWEVEV